MAEYPRNTNKAQSGRSSKGELSEYVFGKVQPQATALEEAVLGALMLDKDALSSVMDIVSPASFYLDAHKHMNTHSRTVIHFTSKSSPLHRA